MKIYISGKITGIEDEAYKLFEIAENKLKLHGYDVVNPMKLPLNHDKSWESYMKECIVALMSCDTIYMLSNYYMSKGAFLEIGLAKELGMNVIFEKNFL
jgi:hypothetical protein